HLSSFFLTYTTTHYIYTLSLHDALPIYNYGGTIGGPIFKNRTFFFFDYDGLTQTGLDTTRAGVPSDAERAGDFGELCAANGGTLDRKSTRLNSSHVSISYAVFCLKKKNK